MPGTVACELPVGRGQVLLPPQVADLLLAAEAQIAPGHGNRRFRLAQVEKPQGLRAVFQVLQENELAGVLRTIRACRPSASWSTSITSALHSTLSVNGSSRAMSPLKISGAAIRHHIDM